MSVEEKNEYRGFLVDFGAISIFHRSSAFKKRCIESDKMRHISVHMNGMDSSMSQSILYMVVVRVAPKGTPMTP
jgi:hypothetical protein